MNREITEYKLTCFQISAAAGVNLSGRNTKMAGARTRFQRNNEFFAPNHYKLQIVLEIKTIQTAFPYFSTRNETKRDITRRDKRFGKKSVRNRRQLPGTTGRPTRDSEFL